MSSLLVATVATDVVAATEIHGYMQTKILDGTSPARFSEWGCSHVSHVDAADLPRYREDRATVARLASKMTREDCLRFLATRGVNVELELYQRRTRKELRELAAVEQLAAWWPRKFNP